MNEFVTPGSAARLVGTFQQPEGHLTSAVQRQPFAVVLLDEIEKASGDVLDLLLQVLGEGRLTDSLGRTVDFTNAFVVMTSNLGVREAAGQVGFQETAADESHAYVKAAERFFRPELFNRLDRIIPFQALGRGEICRIARLVIADVLSREGLARRKCYLRIDDQTLDRIANTAYSARYGARALKRGIERQLTRPVAEKLALLGPQTLTVLSLSAGAAGMHVDLAPLVDADPCPESIALLDLRDVEVVYGRLCLALARIESETAGWGPTGAFTTTELSPLHYRYFLVREMLQDIREAADRFGQQRAARQRKLRYSGPHPTVRHGPAEYDSERANRRVLRDAAAANDLHEFINGLHSRSTAGTESDETQLVEILRRAALLNSVAAGPVTATTEQVLLLVLSPDASVHTAAASLQQSYLELYSESLSLESQPVSGPLPGVMCGLVVRGCHARNVAQIEDGTHLLVPREGHFIPVQVIVLDLPSDADPAQFARAFHERRQAWIRSAGTTAEGDSNPAPWRPVVRIYEEAGKIIDIRTGMISTGRSTPESLRSFLLSSLPLPPEVAEVSKDY